MQPTVHCQVLVVGAGPTGLMLATQLRRRGVEVAIIDRNAGPSIQTKALGVQARTLEIYAQLGIAARAVEVGIRATGANMWANRRRMARLPLGDIGQDLSPFPYLLILGQDDNERLLGEASRAQGSDVQWNTELVDLEQRTADVVATVKRADGSMQKLRAHWVAGCDGAHSAVRELTGIAFPGAPYEHVFFVADATATGPMVPNELNVYLLRDGFHLFFPMRGRDHWRIVGILPAELRGRSDPDFDAVIPSVRAHVGAELAIGVCRWFSTYRIHHRRAERFRQGRCFLLGDAAHIHSPVGAQGMNTGLQDAYNLAWKLALVTTGRAAESLLDSYEAERVPIAERLLSTTDRAFSLIVSDGWVSRLLRTRVIARVAALAMRFERTRRRAFRTISQTGIHYRASAMSRNLPGLPASAPRAGDRIPWMKLSFESGTPHEDLYDRLDDLRFNLIAIGQAVPALPAELSELMATHAIPLDEHNAAQLARASIRTPVFYLLRPDGHVGLAGVRLDADAVRRYLYQHVAWLSAEGVGMPTSNGPREPFAGGRAAAA
ncbi:MAG TPA: FAD-dependent monooxygenase [Burkholderiaceae bacterium]|nr:FAD-dependent monooxygenase [Burkholderiaceae bacterium]